MARVTLDQWIKDALNDPNRDGDCTRVACVHQIGGGGTEEVYSISVTKGAQLDPLKLAEMFQYKAQTTVQDIPGSQLFYLYAFYGGRSEVQAKLPFRVNGNNELTHGETEPPTAEGRLQQNMRHQEAGFQFYFRQISDMVSVQAEQLNQERIHSRLLLAENRDAWTVVKEMIMAKTAQEHEFRMQEMKVLQAMKDREMIMKVGPALVNSLTGREIFPQSTEDTSIVESLIEHLTEENIQSLQKTLPAPLQATFAVRAKRYLEEKQNAQRLAEKALEGRKDPVVDDDAQDENSAAI